MITVAPEIHNRSNDVVEARTKSAARNKCSTHLARIKIDHFPRSGQLEGRRRVSGFDSRYQIGDIQIDDDSIFVGHKTSLPIVAALNNVNRYSYRCEPWKSCHFPLIDTDVNILTTQQNYTTLQISSSFNFTLTLINSC